MARRSIATRGGKFPEWVRLLCEVCALICVYRSSPRLADLTFVVWFKDGAI